MSSRQNEVNARGEYGGDATQLSKNLSITANGFVGLFQFRYALITHNPLFCFFFFTKNLFVLQTVTTK